MGLIRHFFLHLCFLFVLATSQSLTKPENIVGDNRILVGSSTQCGNQVLNTTEGSITYKAEQPLAPNERCVWLIRFPNATDYTVGISTLGFPEPNSDHKLTITTFPTFGPAENTLVDRIGIYNFNETNVLIVTLSTGSSPNFENFTGFSLEYKAATEGIPPVSSLYLDAYIDATVDGARGQWSGVKTEYTVALHLLFYTWGNDSYTGHEGDRIQIIFTERYTWPTSSLLEVYAYGTEESWQLISSIDYATGFQVNENNDMIFLAYRTNTIQFSHEFGYDLENYLL